MSVITSTPTGGQGKEASVFDTRLAGKRFVIAIVESAGAGGEVTERGQRTAEWADAYHRMQHRHASDSLLVRAATVKDAASAKDTVDRTLALASDGSLILLFGHADEVLTAFRAALGVKDPAHLP